jgi:hypothetical protein
MANVNVRFSDSEKERLARDAKAAGMTLSDWVRFRCLDRPGEPQPAREPEAAPEPEKSGCALCGKPRGRLHTKDCYCGGTVSA